MNKLTRRVKRIAFGSLTFFDSVSDKRKLKFSERIGVGLITTFTGAGIMTYAGNNIISYSQSKHESIKQPYEVEQIQHNMHLNHYLLLPGIMLTSYGFIDAIEGLVGMTRRNKRSRKNVLDDNLVKPLAETTQQAELDDGWRRRPYYLPHYLGGW